MFCQLNESLILDRSLASPDLSSLITFGLETLLKKVPNTEEFL